MDFPFPVNCVNCNDKQLECTASSQLKGSCHHCLLNSVECFFPAEAVLAASVAASVMVSTGVGVYPFQRICFHCTQGHQQCQSDNCCQSKCSRCTKRGLPILYKLSSQGQRNDLNAGKSPAVALVTNVAVDAVADAAAIPALALAISVAAVMGTRGRIPRWLPRWRQRWTRWQTQRQYPQWR
jgi:hypothetical protein